MPLPTGCIFQKPYENTGTTGYYTAAICANSVRFGNVRLFRYIESFQEEQEQQFSATAFLLDVDTSYIAFRGTDNTLIGWKEDFNMSFQSEVPSQTAAASYLQDFSSLPIPHLLVGGHSKGGNLAVFASVNAPPSLQARILAVYNNDGPGFCNDILHSAAYLRLQNRVHTVVPEMSIVGMLLEHEEDYRVVASTQHGFYSMTRIPGVSMVRTGTTFQKHLKAVSDLTALSSFGYQYAARRTRTHGRYHFYILRNHTNAETVQDLLDGGHNTITNILRTWGDTPPETRVFMQKMILRLLMAMRQSESKQSSNLPVSSFQKP